ncbi:MAG: glycosylase [Planctomycetes bacterium]|nr:glycosylase [Planctomycetota bacterium]
MIERLIDRCLVRPQDVPPSRPDFKVIGTFNPGVARWHGVTYLLIRVVETVAEQPAGTMAFPRWDFSDDTPTLHVDVMTMDQLDTADRREVRDRRSGEVRLPFTSHLRLATSRDGLTVDWIDPQPTLQPQTPLEAYGLEDARITPLEGEDRCAITYVAPSRHGIVTSLATTSDFKTFERHGPIFTTENKDVALFPRRIGNHYAALHRPVTRTLNNPPEMWFARSPDLQHWGGHRPIPVGHGPWTARVGAGAPPIEVIDGFLELFHGVHLCDPSERIGTYGAVAALLDRDEPWRVLARSAEPILLPTADYEHHGYTPNVVFPTGAVLDGERLLIYSGAADENSSVAAVRLRDVLDSLVSVGG